MKLARVSEGTFFRFAGGENLYVVVTNSVSEFWVREPGTAQWLKLLETDIDVIPVTKDEERDIMTRNRNAKGKPPAATLLKELNERTLQGKLITHIMNVSASMQSVMDEFFLERHHIMTNLNIIARNTGIGYSVTGDNIVLTMPAGVVDPFELV